MRRGTEFLGAWLVILVLSGCVSSTSRQPVASKWDLFEHQFVSSRSYENPFQEIDLTVTFTSPSGDKKTVPAFWDGGKIWKVRFSPNEIGKWSFVSRCNDQGNAGLDGFKGGFTCLIPVGGNEFAKHGPVRVSPDGRYLMHEDSTPFFFWQIRPGTVRCFHPTMIGTLTFGKGFARNLMRCNG